MKNIHKVCAEALAVLETLPRGYIERIPDDVLSSIKTKATRQAPIIDTSKPIDRQGLEKGTIALIFALKRDYWCSSEEEKQELIKLSLKTETKEKELVAGLPTMSILKYLKEN
ncbi:MAG: hypothetical protein LBL34_07180 [Clostridiales bacterium]|jgi:hypothetical protein|nr:hypothetical protein [Clostridiales bacterium]